MSQFWVDPENLSRSGQGYADVQSLLEGLRQQVLELGARYSDSFGDDEEGVEAKQNFDSGNEQFDGTIKQVADALGYVSQGLNQTGQAYGQARDGAEVAANRLLEAGQANGDQQPTPTGPKADTQSPSEAGLRSPEKPLEPHARLGGYPKSLSLSFDPAGRGMEDKVETRDGALLSSMISPRLNRGEQTLFCGHPLGERQRIVVANELPGGVVRLGIDSYDEITPLGNGDGVTLGNPSDPNGARDFPVEEGQRVFLVTEKPGEQVPKPLGERLFMEFSDKDGASLFRESPG